MFYELFISKRFLLSLVVTFLCLSASAGITRIEITKSEIYKNGKQFGHAGTYQKISGLAYGEVDPKNPQNSLIQDIELAPKNANGMVEYVSDFIILCPTEQRKSNGLLFLSLPNRGNPFGSEENLLSRGYIYLWCSWQGDVLPGDGRLTIKVPVAKDQGKEITGWLRTEFGVTQTTPTLNLSSGVFSGNTHHSYETVHLDNKGLSLTKRVHESDSRVAVPNQDWAFSDCSAVDFPGKPSTSKVSIKGGFDPNYIYELVYQAKNPLVLGLGFAAIRDMASFMKYAKKEDTPRLSGDLERMTPVFKAAIMQGISQCSNFTRTFVALGFNQDEEKRKVFDGVNAHVGPRRISLNIRFGRPGGGGMQHEDHLFPGNEPPFSWDSRPDSVSGITGGILSACSRTNSCPLMMQTFTSSEYWQSRAALTHTAPKGNYDLLIPENVRIYLINGTQHGPSDGTNPLSGIRRNPNPVAPTHRALLVALEKWVLHGTEPPKSRYPKLAEGTLVKPDKSSLGWQNIPGVPFNGRVNNPPLLDFGPAFNPATLSGILQDPPKVIPGKHYTVMVPKVDADNNELGGIRNVGLRAPLGTYTGWSLRKAGFGEGDLASLDGMFIPFREKKSDRIAAGDPRPSLEERYGNHAGYVAAVRKAVKELVQERFLLDEDAEQIIQAAESSHILKK